MESYSRDFANLQITPDRSRVSIPSGGLLFATPGAADRTPPPPRGGSGAGLPFGASQFMATPMPIRPPPPLSSSPGPRQEQFFWDALNGEEKAAARTPSRRTQPTMQGCSPPHHAYVRHPAISPSTARGGSAQGMGNSPNEPRRFNQREKQLSYGFETVGYKNMIRLLEHDPLLKSGGILPLLPPCVDQGSKRNWDIQARKWRRDLHMFDYVFIDGVDDEAMRADMLEGQRKEWVSVFFAQTPKEQRCRLSMETLFEAAKSPRVPTKIPVDASLKPILRSEACCVPISDVIPQSASSLTKGTGISPLEVGFKIHIAPSEAVLRAQQTQQDLLEACKAKPEAGSPSPPQFSERDTPQGDSPSPALPSRGASSAPWGLRGSRRTPSPSTAVQQLAFHGITPGPRGLSTASQLQVQSLPQFQSQPPLQPQLQPPFPVRLQSQCQSQPHLQSQSQFPLPSSSPFQSHSPMQSQPLSSLALQAPLPLSLSLPLFPQGWPVLTMGGGAPLPPPTPKNHIHESNNNNNNTNNHNHNHHHHHNNNNNVIPNSNYSNRAEPREEKEGQKAYSVGRAAVALAGDWGGRSLPRSGGQLSGSAKKKPADVPKYVSMLPMPSTGLVSGGPASSPSQQPRKDEEKKSAE